METTTLVREKINTNVNPRVELANKAASVLGYHGLRQHLQVPGELGNALASLEIEYFKLDSVRAYQKSVIEEKMREARNLVNPSDGLLSAWRVDPWDLPKKYAKQSRQLSTEQRLAMAVVAGRAQYVWGKREIGLYKLPIPEFVLHKAIQVKEAVPKVTLEIEGLELYERPQGDPFLVASLDKESYYIEVWDEPKFESEVNSSL